MELYNADTGSLICSVQPIHGQSNEIFDEHGFFQIPPCLWGDTTEGLVEPELLSLDTNLFSIKRNNNYLPHTGEMALWQMRGIVVSTSHLSNFVEHKQVAPQTQLRHVSARESSSDRY